ncbi:MAG TPA: hypothetical protein VIW92_10045 [Thermoanaerobaculia bacterium]
MPNMQNGLQTDVEPVQTTGSFNWTVELFEQQGNCWLRWSTTAPFRAQQGKVCLYANSFPSDPTQAVAVTWDDVNQPNPFNTGQTWGSGWCAAYIAQASPNGPYVYFVQTAVTTTSG